MRIIGPRAVLLANRAECADPRLPSGLCPSVSLLGTPSGGPSVCVCRPATAERTLSVCQSAGDALGTCRSGLTDRWRREVKRKRYRARNTLDVMKMMTASSFYRREKAFTPALPFVLLGMRAFPAVSPKLCPSK